MGMPATLPLDVQLMRLSTRWMLKLAVGVWLALGVMALARQPGWGFQRIHIDGELVRSSLATVRANALPRLSGNFFTLDLKQARQAFESVPWIRQAEVRRHWPGLLKVTLHEHRAVALWQDHDQRGLARDDRLVGDDGTVFQANPGDVEDEGLPQFRGPVGSSAQVWSMHQRLTPVLAPLGRLSGSNTPASIRLLQQSGRGSWSVELDTGAVLELGRGTEDEVVARSQQFVRTVPQAVASYRRPLLFADLRHAEGYALRLSGISTSVSPSNNPAAPRAPAKKN